MRTKTDGELDVMARLASYGLISVAQYLRQIEDDYPEHLPVIAKLLGMARHEASSMARIDRIYKELDVEDDRIAALGWPKMVVLSEFLSYGNRDELLELAGRTTAKELAQILLAQPPGTKPVVFYFTEQQYQRLEKAVVAHGAIRGRPTRNGLSGKEEALLRAIASTE